MATKYQPGTRFGVYEVIEIVGRNDDGYPVVRAKCCVCGVVSQVGGKTLSMSRKNESQHCQHCSGASPVRVTGHRCEHCEDMPWRRPRIRACRCGETYAPEVVQPIEVMHSSGAIDSPGLICVDWR